MERADDTTLPNGTVVDQEVIEAARMGRRAQARVYGEAWRRVTVSQTKELIITLWSDLCQRKYVHLGHTGYARLKHGELM